MVAEHKPVRLMARDLEDLTVLSSMLQDALVPLRDIKFTPHDGSFMMVVNRFCWEDVTPGSGEQPYRRVLAGLRFTDVGAAAFRGIDRDDQDRILELLTIAFCDGEGSGQGHVVLHFAAGGAIRLSVEGLNCAMEDLGDSWPTQWQPDHGDEGTA